MIRVLALTVMAAWLAGGCALLRPDAEPGPAPSPPTGRRVSVVASFYPLYEFAARVGGDAIAVRNLVPAGAAPHDFEPSPRDVAALYASGVLIYNGAGFEPWIEKLLPALPAAVERVETTEGLPLLRGIEDRDAADPHVWVDPVLAQRQVDRILAAFVKVDPERRRTYEANAAVLRADLAALHRRAAETLKNCRSTTLVTAHAAFQYFANRYGLRLIPITGLSPEVEPAPARLRAVLREVRTHRVRAIYFETLASPKVAQTIAREVGARTLVLNPVEGLTRDEQAAGTTYFTVMHENLRHLADGLECR
ncbi:MAG: zinc ABC transporter substrate-binding protein [Armatimonadota bacterium]|nr:zinc ABC transporter substrate-binding protein [Armatimonadota bacterium]